MDILSLPKDILRHLMRKMKIKDRLNLRLTSRAFGELVAQTDAGYFRDGLITQSGPEDPKTSTVRLVIGDQKLHDSNEAGLDEFLQLLGRLFNSISFEVFEFRLTETAFTFPRFQDTTMSAENVTRGRRVIEEEFLHKIADKISADKLIFQVDTSSQLRIALDIAAKFPASMFGMDLGFLPEIEQFLAFPPLDELQITSDARERIGFSEHYDDMPQISSNLVFMLLDKHKNVFLDNVELTSEEWISVLETLSNDKSDRTVQLGVTRSTIVRWMRHHQITEACKKGQIVGEFTMLRRASSEHSPLELRYGHCWIWIERFAWRSSNLPALVELTNFAPPTADMYREM